MNKAEIKAYKASYYQKNKERIRAQQFLHRKEMRENGYSLSKKNNLKQKFGLSIEDYEKMLINQNYVCAICSKKETTKHTGKVRMLAVDHDHETGKVRMLLCSTCNNGLGCFKDNVDLLKTAIEYLNKHKEEKE